MLEQLVHALAQHWWLALGACVAAWLLRNRYQKGLAAYPGPFLASLTDWWRVLDAYRNFTPATHIALHRKYGDVVRLGPNALSFADPRALRAIYGLNRGFVKSDFYVVQQPVGPAGRPLASLFSTVDEAFHARFRRCVNSYFSMSGMVQYEPLINNTLRLFLSRTETLYAGRDKPVVDLTRWLQFCAFDVINECTYSRRGGFVERNEDVDGMVGLLGWFFRYSAMVGQMPILDHFLVKNPIKIQLAKWGIGNSAHPVVRFARARMAERKPLAADDGEKDEEAATTTACSSPDLLSKFLSAQAAHPDFFNDTLVLTMATSMANAGSDTTAISAAAVFYHLLRRPACLARLRGEIDAAARAGRFADRVSGLVTWHEAQRLPYLDACVKEAFRMHPAAGLPYERVVPPEGADIAGRFVPGGTVVGCSPWVVHRNRDVFGEDVDEYKPERWLVDEKASGSEREAEERRVRQMDGHMIQFGMGSRTCIGKNIALLEIYKLVPSMLRRFEITLDDPDRDWDLINGWFVKQENFFVRLALRDLVQPDEETNEPEKEKEIPVT